MVHGRRWLCSGLGALIVAAFHPRSARAQVDENREILQRYADAWSRGDVAGIVASYHADFTLHYFGRHPLAGDHVGKAAALKTLAEVSRKTNRKLVEIVAVMSGAVRSGLIVREGFERDGVRATLERVLVFTTKDGRLHECWVYDADQAAVDQFLR